MKLKLSEEKIEEITKFLTDRFIYFEKLRKPLDDELIYIMIKTNI